ncbi:MAG: poly-gamma-glutamate system protein [Candidatus Methylomirabilia bacterium]
MRWRSDRAPVSVLVFLSVLSVLALVLAERSVVEVRESRYEQKLRASKNVLLGMQAVAGERRALGIEPDPVNDPNETGLVGPEFTLVTTDRGSLSAKLTALNPNFGAVLVEMLAKAKLRKGDTVAVGMTGSFPVLNMAVIAALEALDLKPLVISSVGASSWGANEPRLTWLDMERILAVKGITRTRSIAATIGGGKDVGRGLSPEGRRLVGEAIARNKVRPLSEPLLEENIRRRIALYEQAARGKRIGAYINVGGGVASLGSTINGDLFPPGLTVDYRYRNFPVKGVMILMAERNIPVIHLLNIQEIAGRYQLPVAPEPLPEIGEGPLYFKPRYDRLRLVLITLALIAATGAMIRLNLGHHLAQLRQALRGAGSSGGSRIPLDEEETTHETTKT